MKLGSLLNGLSGLDGGFKPLSDVYNQISDGGLHLPQGFNSKLDLVARTAGKMAANVERNKTNSYFGISARDAKAAYQKLYSHGAILSCNYAVQLIDIYKIGHGIPWFASEFPMSWLATDVDVSLGSMESESFYAGSYQCNYMTQQTADTIDVTFIETRNAAISHSYDLCQSLIFPADGSVNEPKKYTFALAIGVFDTVRKANLSTAVWDAAYLVSVKDGSFNLTSTGRSEIIKAQVTFQKIRPYKFK